MSSIREEWEGLKASRQEAVKYLGDNSHKPRVFTFKNLGAFFTSIPEVIQLIRQEPEILVFLILQWVCIFLGYLAWIQMLRWIPKEVWQAAAQNHGNNNNTFELLNLALMAWSLLIIAVVSYPLGICNAAIVAVHDLRTCNENVNILKCLAVATRHTGKIWLFTLTDAWITILAIVRRLPKKHDHETAAEKAMSELLYYAWKLATMAIVPALVNGRDLIQAGKDSVSLLSAQPSRALGLRLGYSAVCWLVGILAYVGAIYWVIRFGPANHSSVEVFSFYELMAFPICIAVGVVVVLVRPIFLLSVAKFYTDVIDVKAEIETDIAKVPPLSSIILNWKTCLFVFLLAEVLLALIFGERLGFVRWIHHLAQIDLSHLPAVRSHLPNR